MNFTQEQVNWIQQQMAQGVPYDNAVATLMAHLQAQQPAVAQPVEQAMQPAQPAQAASPQVMQSVANPNPHNNILAALTTIADEAALDEDHAAITSGKPPRAGAAWLRIRGYIEIGVHQGKNTTFSPKPICLVVVELHHPDHYVEYEGKREPKELSIRISKTHSQNSKFPKFFKSLQRALGNHPQTGQPITHLSQGVGMACLATVYHNKSDDKVYANFDLDGAWSFQPTHGQNPDGSNYNVDVPPLYNAPLLFLMDSQAVNKHPEHVKQMWDSIYIAGERKSKGTNGEEKVTSNNYFQELIAKSQNWVTSETKRILDSLGAVTSFGAANATNTTVGVNPTQPVHSGVANAAPAMQAPVQPVAQQYEAPVAQPQVAMQPAMVQQAPVYQEPAPVAQHTMAQMQAPQAAPVAPAYVQQPVQEAAAPVQQALVAPQPVMSAEAFMNQFGG
ncbi:hypothetical protein VPHK436_0034 [Vibrio phage K436]